MLIVIHAHGFVSHAHYICHQREEKALQKISLLDQQVVLSWQVPPHQNHLLALCQKYSHIAHDISCCYGFVTVDLPVIALDIVYLVYIIFIY